MGRYLLRFSSPSSQHLICFPWAGAGASVYRPWLPLLAGEVTLHGVQLPARGSRISEPVPTNLQSEALHIAAEIEAAACATCHLVGHSMGAKLAYLTAVVLCGRGVIVSSLTVMGCRGPGRETARSRRNRAKMSDDDVIGYLRQFGGTPEEVLTNRELLDLLLGVVRGDLMMNAPPLLADATVLPMPVLAIGGTADKHVSAEDIAAWRAVSGKAFTHQMIDGGHFFPISHRDLVLASIRGHLRNAIL